ncbi:MAG: hypothetical protein HY089_13615 [Ignavibacteriales bacterium]|nr:hypothetical protein [Ignavibacteriales bacterium]
MRKRNNFFRVIPLLLLAHCESPLPPEEMGELMPSETGNYWFYQVWNFTAPDTFKGEITRQVEVTIDGEKHLASAYTSYLPNNWRPSYEWLYWNGPDGLYQLGGITKTDTFLYKTLMFKYPAKVGESWSFKRIYYGYDQKFHFFDTLTVSLLGKNEEIDTPAGKFKCYAYTYRKRPADDVFEEWDYYYYYYAGIGEVAYITRGVSDGRIIDRRYLISHSSAK